MSGRFWIAFSLLASAWDIAWGIYFAIVGDATLALVMGLLCGLFIGWAAVEWVAGPLLRRPSA